MAAAHPAPGWVAGAHRATRKRAHGGAAAAHRASRTPCSRGHGEAGLFRARTARGEQLELQGHGHTRDIGRAFSYEAFGDDIAGLVDLLRLGPADLLGYSLGASACLRAAIQHPDRVRRLAIVSIPCRRDGWFPEVLQGMSQVGSAQFDQMKQSEMYRAWAAVAPDPDAFPTLMDRTGALLLKPYDWSDEVRGLAMPVQLVYGDADSIPPSHAAEFFALLGGGLQDAGWDGALRTDNRLCIIPGRTHYTICAAPPLAGVIDHFTLF